MKVEILAIITLSDRIFGSLTEDRTKLDILQHISRMIREGSGIEGVFVKEFKLILKEGDAIS